MGIRAVRCWSFGMTLLAACCFIAPVLAQEGGRGTGRGSAPNWLANVSALEYQLVSWPLEAKSAAGFDAGPWNFIQVPSMAVAPNGNVLLLHRGAHPIMEFEPSGKFVRSWGNGMFSEGKVVNIPPKDRPANSSRYSVVYGPAACESCGAHVVRVDPQGNIWLVDAGGHVVYKTDTQGRVLLQLGTKGVSGTDRSHFNLPTDVAFAPNGDIYISDGYGNARVVKFSPSGEFLLEFGKRGTGPGEFGLPHNVQVDAQGKVYVSDRDNQRIQVFDPSGKFLSEWAGTGGISAMLIVKDQSGQERIWTSGVLRDLNGKPLGRLNEVHSSVHGGIAVTSSGDVYFGLLNGTAQKFVKKGQ
ncbi:MAG: peptidyl-alpha-hydroxyglycine alpha-amidating lyase family protein [Candidatus Korobacteraceae bacterium]